MKPLLILGFALTVSFLAPLAQAASLEGSAPAPTPVAAPPPAGGDERHADPPPQAAPERQDPDRPLRGDSGPSAPPDRERHHQAPAVIYNTQAPDAADDSQDSTQLDEGQSDATTDDSYGDSNATTAHYSMDDLVNAMQDLDSSY
jgi:hypothetical protein